MAIWGRIKGKEKKQEKKALTDTDKPSFIVIGVHDIVKEGIIVTGKIVEGIFFNGDAVYINSGSKTEEAVILNIAKFNKNAESACKGEISAFHLKGIKIEQIQKDDIFYKVN